MTDIDTFLFADLNGVKAGGLTAHGMHAGRSHLNVLAVGHKALKKPLRHRAAANVTCANEENAFHDGALRERTQNQPRIEHRQVNGRAFPDEADSQFCAVAGLHTRA
jgi:hypothetical protein